MAKKRILNLVKAVSFILIFVTMVYALGYIFIPKSNEKGAGVKYYVTKVFHGEKENTLDVFCMGNSDLYRSISPMQMYHEQGITSFDCAMPCASTIDLYYIFKDLLTCQMPKVLVLETDAFYFSSPKYKNDDSALKTHLQYLSDMVKTTDEDINEEINNAFPTISYHNRWKDLSLNDFVATPDYTTRKDSNKGFNINARVNGCNGNTHMKPTDETDPIQPAIRLYIDKILQLCKDNNIDVVLYEAPTAKSWNYKRHNAVQQYADEKGLPYLDYNTFTDKLGIDWSKDTKDKGEHMNIYGAAKCSKYMGEFLKKNYDLPDRRNDSEYSSWNDDYKAYVKAIAKAEKNESASKGIKSK